MGASKGTHGVEFDREYTGSTGTLAQVRDDVVEFVTANGLHHVASDAQLVVSELTSNAVHASPDLPYRVAARISREHLVIAVTNESSASLPARPDWQPDDVLASQGRGLAIVEALTDRVDVESSKSHHVVSAFVRIVAS